jgi:hypothetical protein
MRQLQTTVPQRIGIDVSETFALADGLSKTLYDQLVAALSESYRQRPVSAEELTLPPDRRARARGRPDHGLVGSPGECAWTR